MSAVPSTSGLSKYSLNTTSEDHSSSSSLKYKLPHALNDTRKGVKQREERYKIVQSLDSDDDDYETDLTKTMKTPMGTMSRDLNNNNEVYIENDFNNNNIANPHYIPPREYSEPLVPNRTDISYIFKHQARIGKCSPFSRVLVSRQKPVATPYLKENDETKTVSFDFRTKSPRDLVLENTQRKSVHTV